jgi:hypothetical protein
MSREPISIRTAERHWQELGKLLSSSLPQA